MLLFGYVLLAIIGMFEAFTLMWLWFWFLVPLGLPIINFWHSFGISLIASYLSHQYQSYDEAAAAKLASWLFLKPIIYLVLGFLIHFLV